MGLLNRYQRVLVSVNDSRRRVVGRDMVHRRNQPPDFLDPGFIGNRHEHPKSSALGVELLKREWRGKFFQDAAPQRVFTWIAVVQKVRGRKETSDRLHPAADSIDFVLGL